MITNKEIILLSLSKLKGVGNVALRSMLSAIESGLDIDQLAAVYPKVKKGLATSPDYQQTLDNDILACKINDVSIITAFNPSFPPAMYNDYKGPLFIYVKGNRILLQSAGLAIIGTRTPDVIAQEYAKRVSTHFSQMDIPIISGLAIGCDTVAHEATLNAGGQAIGVLGHGLHTIAPKENVKLADRIISTGGLLISQFPMGTDPTRYTFVERDRTQATLSKAIILVQSDINGGSLHACRSAISAGKQLFVLPPTDSEKDDANSIIYSGSDLALEMLKCDAHDLKRVIEIKSKSDYGLIENVFLKGSTKDSYNE